MSSNSDRCERGIYRLVSKKPITTNYIHKWQHRCTHCGDLLDFKTSLKPLLHFEGDQATQSQTGTLFAYHDYLELVDWSGRIIRKDKRGFIDTALPPILNRLQITQEQWHLNTTQFETIHIKRFNRAIPSLNTG